MAEGSSVAAFPRAMALNHFSRVHHPSARPAAGATGGRSLGLGLKLQVSFGAGSSTRGRTPEAEVALQGQGDRSCGAEGGWAGFYPLS